MWLQNRFMTLTTRLDASRYRDKLAFPCFSATFKWLVNTLSLNQCWSYSFWQENLGAMAWKAWSSGHNLRAWCKNLCSPRFTPIARASYETAMIPSPPSCRFPGVTPLFRNYYKTADMLSNLGTLATWYCCSRDFWYWTTTDGFPLYSGSFSKWTWT